MEALHLVPNLIEQVHGRLVDAIAEGALPPGKRVTQEELAEQLSVSRQPVSHALQLLKRQGLVVEHGRRGLSIAPIEPERIRELYQLRAAIDGLASRLAAERVATGGAGSNEVALLKSALLSGQALGEGASVHALVEADVQFHTCIYRVSGNRMITETVADRWPHFRRGMGIAVRLKGWPTVVWNEHREIAQAIEEGNPRAAEAASVHHTERAATALYQHMIAEAAVA